jgi:chemotaxis protein CheD
MFSDIVPYTLKPGQVYLARKTGFIRTVVGSAVSICIWDEELKYACMCHFVFPMPTNGDYPSGLYATESIPAMLRTLSSAGSKRRSLSAHILGGASATTTPDPTAKQNVEAARFILNQNRIPVICEDVGGRVGRKIVFNAENGNVAVVKVRKLRDGDWNDDTE